MHATRARADCIPEDVSSPCRPPPPGRVRAEVMDHGWSLEVGHVWPRKLGIHTGVHVNRRRASFNVKSRTKYDEPIHLMHGPATRGVDVIRVGREKAEVRQLWNASVTFF